MRYSCLVCSAEPELFDGKSQLTGKDLDAREDGGQREKGAAEDKMVGWHHRLKT